jgi:calcineurin-like phosphoesterase family protein
MKKLSFNSKGQKIWFVADLHIAHNKPFILNPRQYKTIEEAMEHTFEMLRQTIGPDDIVFNLGDAVVGAGFESTNLAKRIVFWPCKHQYFIWGNHNAGMKNLYDECRHELGLLADDVEIYPLDYPKSQFTFLGHRAEITIDGWPIVLDHYPIASWNKLKNAMHIHGHCHRNLKEDLGLRRLDVGWDWKRRPVEWSEVLHELASRTVVAPDHHGETGDS